MEVTKDCSSTYACCSTDAELRAVVATAGDVRRSSASRTPLRYTKSSQTDLHTLALCPVKSSTVQFKVCPGDNLGLSINGFRQEQLAERHREGANSDETCHQRGCVSASCLTNLRPALQIQDSTALTWFFCALSHVSPRSVQFLICRVLFQSGRQNGSNNLERRIFFLLNFFPQRGTNQLSSCTHSAPWRDACLEVVEQQESEDNGANHWPQTSGANTQSRPVRADGPGTVPRGQQMTRTQPMPIRVKAAPSSLRKTLRDSGGTTS